MKEVSFPKWTLVAVIGVLLVLIGPIPEWASNTGLLSRMGGFGDSLAVMLNFILRFFLVLISGSIATIALIGEGVSSRAPHRIIVGVIFTLVMIYIFFESPRRVWAGNQDAPLTWSLGLIAYFIAVWDMMESNLHSQPGRFLIPLGIAIVILGWINLIDLLACPAGCRAWALESGVAFGVLCRRCRRSAARDLWIMALEDQPSRRLCSDRALSRCSSSINVFFAQGI